MLKIILDDEMFVHKRGKLPELLVATFQSLIIVVGILTDGHGSEGLACHGRMGSRPLFLLLLHKRILTSLLTDGRKERVQFDKITARVSRLCYGLDPEHVDAAAITQKVISGVYHGVTTVELDNLVSHLRLIAPNCCR